MQRRPSGSKQQEEVAKELSRSTNTDKEHELEKMNTAEVPTHLAGAGSKCVEQTTNYLRDAGAEVLGFGRQDGQLQSTLP